MDMTIKLGRLVTNGRIVTIPWDHIGILVVGRPGSGKSHVIASILTQYALKGADIIVAEYNADSSNPQSLLYRIQHLEHALKRPSVTSGADIVELIQWLKKELTERQNGLKPRTPLVVVLDEFFQFAASIKAPEEVNVRKEGDAYTPEGQTIIKQKTPTFWEDLLASQTDMRKNNIRLILAAQETSSTATSYLMRQVRDMFRFKLVMNLSPKGADLIGITDRTAQREIDKLKPGYIYVNGSIIGVPFPINPTWIQKCKETLLPRENTYKEKTEPITTDWTDRELQQYLDALFATHTKHVLVLNKQGRRMDVDTKEGLIEFLVLWGLSPDKIRSLVKGRDSDIITRARHYKEEYGL